MANDSVDPHHVNPRRGGSPAQKPGPSHWQRILTGVAAIGVIALTVVAAILLALQDLPGDTQMLLPIVSQPTPYTPAPPATNTPLSLPAAVPPTDTPVIEPTPTATTEMPTVAQPTATPPLPPTPVAPICRPPASWVSYTVRPGDTLVSLAYRYRISVSQLMQANCLVSPVLYAGQWLYVPPVVITPTPRPPCGPPPPAWVQYTVQPGDTLYSLSVRTHTTVYAIVQANCLSSYTIYVGQQLWLPSLPPVTATFTPTPPTPPTITDTPTATTTPGGDTPTPTLSPTPGGDTPTPTLTVGPGDTPTPTSTLSPTPGGDTPTPTLTLEPGDTSTPTATPGESPTATPTLPPPTDTPTSVPPTATNTPGVNFRPS